MKNNNPDDFSFDLARLENIIHSRIRLAIMTFLYKGHSPTFAEFRKALTLTDGNLGANLNQLEKEGLVKSVHSNQKNPRFSITPKGRKRFGLYLEALVELID